MIPWSKIWTPKIFASFKLRMQRFALKMSDPRISVWSSNVSWETFCRQFIWWNFFRKSRLNFVFHPTCCYSPMESEYSNEYSIRLSNLWKLVCSFFLGGAGCRPQQRFFVARDLIFTHKMDWMWTMASGASKMWTSVWVRSLLFLQDLCSQIPIHK